MHVIYTAWASALLVPTARAMPEPLRVGRVTRELPRFFHALIKLLTSRILGGSEGAKTNIDENNFEIYYHLCAGMFFNGSKRSR